MNKNVVYLVKGLEVVVQNTVQIVMIVIAEANTTWYIHKKSPF